MNNTLRRVQDTISPYDIDVQIHTYETNVEVVEVYQWHTGPEDGLHKDGFKVRENQDIEEKTEQGIEEIIKDRREHGI